MYQKKNYGIYVTHRSKNLYFYLKLILELELRLKQEALLTN